MKKDELFEFKTYMQKNVKIRYDGKVFFWLSDSNIWQAVSKGEILRTIRKCYLKGTIQDTSDDARCLMEEIRSNVEYAFQRKERKSRPIVITSHGCINLTALAAHDLINAVEKIIPEDFEIHAFDFKFIPNAEWKKAPNFCAYVKKSLQVDLTDAKTLSKKRKLLSEILAYAVSEVYGAKKMILLLGPSNSGKTVLLNLLRAVAGSRGYTPLSLCDMADRFRAAALADVPLVLNDEIGAQGLKNLDILKKVVSGEPVILEKKGQQPEACTIHVKPIFATNVLPELDEYDSYNGFAERLQILTFPSAIPRDQWDLDLTDKIISERDVIFSRAILDSLEFLKHLQFSDDPAGSMILAAYKAENASVETFVRTCCLRGNEEEYTEVLYKYYTDFCARNCYLPIKIRGFRKHLIQLGFKADKGRVRGGDSRSRIHGLTLREGQDDE